MKQILTELSQRIIGEIEKIIANIPEDEDEMNQSEQTTFTIEEFQYLSNQKRLQKMETWFDKMYERYIRSEK